MPGTWADGFLDCLDEDHAPLAMESTGTDKARQAGCRTPQYGDKCDCPAYSEFGDWSDVVDYERIPDGESK